jgi:4-carboxymuconolactone decarboxylase
MMAHDRRMNSLNQTRAAFLIMTATPAYLDRRGTHVRLSSPDACAAGDRRLCAQALTDDVLFADIWERAELSKRDRSLVTVAALITNGSTEQLRGHLARAKENGLAESELKEVIIHLAFYAGWPRAMSAITVAKEIFSA